MRALASQAFSTAVLAAALLFLSPRVHAASVEKPLYQMDNATIDARIRAAFPGPDAFAAAKIVGQLFAEKIDMGRAEVARAVILDGLEKESARFRAAMPDFRIDERNLFVADNGVVMTGRMMGTRADGTKMDTAFATVFTRDKSGRIVTQRTLEVAKKPD